MKEILQSKQEFNLHMNFLDYTYLCIDLPTKWINIVRNIYTNQYFFMPWC